MSHIFSWPCRVYYEDTDAGGVVYYANYLKYLERARTEWLRQLGIEQQAWREAQGVQFVVRRCHLDYLQPAVLDDVLHVTAVVAQYTKVRLVLQQEISRDHADGRSATILLRAEVMCACVRVHSGRPCALPVPLIQTLMPST